MIDHTIDASQASHISETTTSSQQHDKLRRLAYQQLAEDIEIGYDTWHGPWGAVHVIKSDFWERNYQLITAGLSAHQITDDLYIHYPGFGKIQRIHTSLVPEFQRSQDESFGHSHLADPQAIIKRQALI